MQKFSLNQFFKGDKVIWGIYLFLSVMSLVVIYSTTATIAIKKNSMSEWYVLKHFVFLLLGGIVMYFVHKIKLESLKRWSKIPIIVGIALLLLTFFVGVNLNSADRWIKIPIIGLTFQSSDVAKFALVFFIAGHLAKHRNNLNDFKKAYLPLLIVVGITCLLILPSNFSTAALVGLNSLFLFIIGKVNSKFILGTIGAGILFLLILFMMPKSSSLFNRVDTWKARIQNFGKEEDNDENFQAMQARFALAQGGITGKGPGNSVQKNFLPHPYSDFVFAIIWEEYGLLGAFAIMFSYSLLMFRIVSTAAKSNNYFAMYLAVGIGTQLMLQTFVNMAVAVGLFPVTGQTLPLISMGGSSIVFTCAALGVIQSISVYNQRYGLKQQSINHNT